MYTILAFFFYDFHGVFWLWFIISLLTMKKKTVMSHLNYSIEAQWDHPCKPHPSSFFSWLAPPLYIYFVNHCFASIIITSRSTNEIKVELHFQDFSSMQLTSWLWHSHSKACLHPSNSKHTDARRSLRTVVFIVCGKECRNNALKRRTIVKLWVCLRKIGAWSIVSISNCLWLK